MKAKYLILFLILALLFNLGLACGDSESKVSENLEVVEKSELKTIEVMYLVICTAKSVSLTYNNDQGGTQQISEWEQMIDLYKAINFKESLIYGVKGLEKFVNKGTMGIVVTKYYSFPRNEFLYISAQNDTDSGYVTVIIIVNNEVWKNSTSSGAYVIATANGYYDK